MKNSNSGEKFRLNLVLFWVKGKSEARGRVDKANPIE
jgi:hypothetical protein